MRHKIYTGPTPPGADHGETGKQPKQFEPFVLAGKAKTVFKIIELKAKREALRCRN